MPGLLFRGPLQFSSTIRANYLRWHRLSGRIFVVCGVVIGTSALAMSFRVPAIGVYSRCAKRFGISGFSDGPELLASDSHWPPHIRAPLSGISCYLAQGWPKGSLALCWTDGLTVGASGEPWAHRSLPGVWRSWRASPH
ncbi:MAG: hypothetical protein DMG51_04570 [Acidobacteria bacterium]|nr:MAG: hypothetical protein DMG51_04570 [Acidobacteriota bacterium]